MPVAGVVTAAQSHHVRARVGTVARTQRTDAVPLQYLVAVPGERPFRNGRLGDKSSACLVACHARLLVLESFGLQASFQFCGAHPGRRTATTRTAFVKTAAAPHPRCSAFHHLTNLL